MKCKHCGALVDDNSKFCSVCGNIIEKDPASDQNSHEEKPDKAKAFMDGFKKFNFKKTKAESEEEQAKTEEESKKPENSQDSDEKLEENSNSDPDFEKEPQDFNQESEESKEEPEVIEVDRSDRFSKTNRRFENLGEEDLRANQKSTIEQIQDKITNNETRKKSSDYYIDENEPMAFDRDLEEKLDKLMGNKEKETSSVTISSAIREIQNKNRRALKPIVDTTKADKPLKDSSPVVVKEPDKEEKKSDQKKKKTKEKSKGKAKNTDGSKKDIDFKKIATSKNILIGLIGVLVALLLGLLYMKLNKPNDVELALADYITVSYEGEDGKAVPHADIDGDKLLADFKDKVKYISRDNNKDSYQTPAEEMVADIKANIIYQYSKDEGLSNGDEITVIANLDNIKLSDKYNVLMSNASKPVLVSGIVDDNFIDPFNFIDVKFEGASPNITLMTSIKDDAPEYVHTIEIVPAKTSGISEGEEVAVSLNYDENTLETNYGVRLNPTSKNFVASATQTSDDTSDSEYIKSTTNLSEDMLGELKYQAGKLVKDTILYKNIISIDNINYLGSLTGYKDDQSGDIKNKVYLIYEVESSERLPDSNYSGSFKYYTFVEYQNVKKSKGDDGKFFSQGPMTTDNQIYHKFFVESDYKYYQIEYQGFGFIEKALAKVGAGLDGFSVNQDNQANINSHFATSDGVVGEYEADGQRISLKADGSLTYQTDMAVHRGSYSLDGDRVSATIQGVNTDNPIIFTYENGRLNAQEQGEFKATNFVKIENF